MYVKRLFLFKPKAKGVIELICILTINYKTVKLITIL